jgi:hypothetical protein
LNDVVVCMPIRERMEPETEFALENNVGFKYRLLTEVGLPVDEARNRLTERALASKAQHIVWADADAFWRPGCLERMLSWTTADPLKVVGSVYGARMHFSAAIARQTADGVSVPFELIRRIDGTIPCHFIGAHVLVCSRQLLERVGPQPWALDENDGSEDFAFARRIREAGCAQHLDTRAWTFHVENGIMYVPGSSAYVLVDGKLEQCSLPPTAPFPRGRDYGAVVNAARRGSWGIPEAELRRWLLARIRADLKTGPVVAERFRIPTENELAHIFGDPSTATRLP